MMPFANSKRWRSGLLGIPELCLCVRARGLLRAQDLLRLCILRMFPVLHLHSPVQNNQVTSRPPANLALITRTEQKANHSNLTRSVKSLGKLTGRLMVSL